MIKALLCVRFRALFAGLMNQTRKKNKKSIGMVILYAVLYLYLAAVICGMMGFTFWTLAEPYHQLGLDWLYFAMAGLMSLGLAILGSVFATQSQLYDAKDNALLLSMPIPPGKILLSRMVVLLSLNLLYAALAFVPAMVVYAIVIKASVVNILLQTVSLLAIAVLAQAVACLFGWLLHLLLSKMNKSAASMIYMVAFLVIYFSIYSQAGDILNSMATGGEAIAAALQTWVWPLYAAGRGCMGNILLFLAFVAICAVIFAVVYGVLSATFLSSATMQRSTRRKKLTLSDTRTASPAEAVVRKELGKFLNCPVYLTNMGLGILLTAALAVAGLVFRSKILMFLEVPELKELFSPYIPMLICAMPSSLISTMGVSTPSVSLEGKNLWILKSLPLSSKDILQAKLRFHCRLTVPVTAVAGLVLSVAYGCGIADIVLCTIIPGLLALLCGVLGLVCGLHWARLDYISEAYPCKQSVSVLVTMLAMMGLPVVLGLLYSLVLAPYCSVTLFMVLTTALLAALCLLFYQVLIRWGTKKWDSL